MNAAPRIALALLCLSTGAAAAATRVACPYAPSELAASFSAAFRAGVGKQSAVPGGTQYSCSYRQDRGNLTLTVTQTVLPAAEHKRLRPEFEKGLVGKLTPMGGDPDGAKWQMDPYAPNFIALHYLHGSNRVELKLTGGYLRTEVMQPKLLRLRRLR